MSTSTSESPAATPDPLAPNAYEFTYPVRYSEVGRNGVMTLPALINAFQDCSFFQSEALGLGTAHLKREARAWVLTHWQIIIDRYPTLCEVVTVGTFATHFHAVQASRSFYLRDATGDLMVRANSTWVFMDLDRGRPARPAPADTEPYGVSEPLELPPESRRIAVPDELTAGTPLTVGPSLIDTNQHVNNCHYVQMALEQLRLDQISDEARERGVHQLRVDYRRAAVLGDVIVPKVAVEQERAVSVLADEAGATYAVVEFS